MTLTPKHDAKVVWIMAAVLLAPAVITLMTVHVPSPIMHNAENPNPTPYGYTVSLLLFIVPIIALAIWFLRHPRYAIEKRAFWWTLGILTPAGFVLDVFFGHDFLTFKNEAATLGMRLPEIDMHGLVPRALPIEEFAFYFMGFLVVLLLYTWSDLYWLGAYSVPDYSAAPGQSVRVVRIHLPILLTGVLLIPAGIIFKRYGPHPYHKGFPGYFIFLVATAFAPASVLYHVVQPYINWRAFSFTFIALLLVSLLWEGTLGVPYAWWGYRYEQMLGLTVPAWANLPIEAVLVWLVTAFATVIVFETVRVVLHRKVPDIEVR